MKNQTLPLLLTLVCTLVATVNQALAQGTAFTYQGRLSDGTGAANGRYDLTFSVWNSSSGPAQVGSTLTNLNVGVTNGLFTSR